MAEQQRYLLRSTSSLAKFVGKPLYLESVAKRGRQTHWSLDPAMARRFTAKQRDNFIAGSYAHVTGRWVKEQTAHAQFEAALGVGAPPVESQRKE